MTTSLWNRTAPALDTPPDVMVIGAGVTGLSAAIAFARRGLKTVVLERRAVGGGASTRNAGFLMRGAADNYAAGIREWGREKAREVWAWTEDNLGALREFGVEELGSYKRIPSCLCATEPGEHEELETSAALMREDGFEVELISSGRDAIWSSGVATLGLVNPNDASIDPRNLLNAVGARARDAGVTIIEDAHVDRLFEQDGQVVADMGMARIAAPRCLVCLNAWTPTLLPELDGLVQPRRGQMLAIRGDAIDLDASYYLNHGSEYIRKTARGEVVVGGCRKVRVDEETGYADVITQPIQTALETFGARALGLAVDDLRDRVVARWAGTMGFSPDGLPLIGPVAGREQTWVCAGFTGHGMSMGWLAGQRAVGCIIDAEPSPFPLDRFS